MNHPWLQLGAALAVLVLLAVVTIESWLLGQRMGWIEAEEPAFVFTIPHEGSSSG